MALAFLSDVTFLGHIILDSPRKGAGLPPAGTKALFLACPCQMTMKTKQRVLTEDWELLKQRRFIEEQVSPQLPSQPLQSPTPLSFSCAECLRWRLAAPVLSSDQWQRYKLQDQTGFPLLSTAVIGWGELLSVWKRCRCLSPELYFHVLS